MPFVLPRDGRCFDDKRKNVSSSTFDFWGLLKNTKPAAFSRFCVSDEQRSDGHGREDHDRDPMAN